MKKKKNNDFEIKKLTKGEVIKILSESKSNYFLFKNSKGIEYGMNAGIIRTLEVKNNSTPEFLNQSSGAVSYRECSFQEYLNYKMPFRPSVKRNH